MVVALVLLAASVTQRQLAQYFPWGTPLDHHAVYILVAVLIAAGGFYLLIPGLIRRAGEASGPALALILLVGLLMRLLLFGTEPALEDDSYRYLWDGALVVEGFDPYRHTPAQALANDQIPAHALADEHRLDVERVNHPWLRTPYPPLAQAGFALAAWIEPFSLDAWRAVVLAAEVVTLALLHLLLKSMGRSPLWLTLYWWNPLIVREFAGAAHMDALLMPLLAGAALLMVRQRWFGAAGALVLAAGVKFWPIVLLPMALLRLRHRPWMMIGACVAILVALGLLLLPMLETALTPSSGIAAFAERWQMNGAVFGVLAEIAGDFGIAQSWVRWFVAAKVGLLALYLAWREPDLTSRWVCRMLAVTAALLLLSPTGFPWYASWIIVLMVACPVMPLLWLTALLPLYELRFVFDDMGQAEVFHDWIVWLQFGPIWLGLLVMGWRQRARFTE
jgi:alpha-1,6-mannosyltransferase